MTTPTRQTRQQRPSSTWQHTARRRQKALLQPLSRLFNCRWSPHPCDPLAFLVWGVCGHFSWPPVPFFSLPTLTVCTPFLASLRIANATAPINSVHACSLRRPGVHTSRVAHVGPHVSGTLPSRCAHCPNDVWGSLEYLLSDIDGVAVGVACVAGSEAAQNFFFFF